MCHMHKAGWEYDTTEAKMVKYHALWHKKLIGKFWQKSLLSSESNWASWRIFPYKRILKQFKKSVHGPCRGWTWHIYRQGSAEYFLGFEFWESVFFGYWSQLLYFLGLLNKGYSKVFHMFNSIFLVPVLFTRCFNNYGSSLLSYHARLLRNE